jgi:small GTP-binding protein
MSTSKIEDLAKISIIGHPAVGKTTIVKLLTKDPIDQVYIPTQGFDLKSIRFKKYDIKVWDFGGQKSYLTYLEEYLAGSDLIFIVTDSTPVNVLNSRKLIELSSKIVEDDCPIIAIANKQDLCEEDEGRMNQKLIEDLLQIKTYGLTAIDNSERNKIIKIIESELNKTLSRRRVKNNEL